MFQTVRKNAFRKNSKAKRGNCFDREQKQPPEVFMKKGVLKNSQNLQENICARIPFIKKETLAEVFSCAFCKLSKNSQKQSPEVFFEKRCSQKFHIIHRNFIKFKVVGLRPATLLKKRLWHWCFSVKFVKFLRTSLLQNTSGRLFLREDIVL